MAENRAGRTAPKYGTKTAKKSIKSVVRMNSHAMIKKTLDENYVNMLNCGANGGNAIYLCVDMGKNNSLKFFIDNYDMNIDRISNIGRTPLMLASVNGDLKAIDILIRAGANIDKQNSFGETALSLAVLYEKHDAAKALIDAGADLYVSYFNGETIMHRALRTLRRPEKILGILIDNGVRFDINDISMKVASEFNGVLHSERIISFLKHYKPKK